MKKVLLISVFILIVGYLVFSASLSDKRPGEEVCHALEVVVSNSENQFVDVNEIKKSIESSEISPINKYIADINTIQIEEFVLKNQHIRKAEVYITNQSNIRIVLEERKPILRIITNEGENYYIDSEAKRMPLSRRYTVYLPIATGSIKESFAQDDLYKFALFLHSNEFWNAQIEQIIVKANNDIAFVPRVGNHTIILGSIEDLDKKLDKLMTFYRDGLNRIGWNKYSTINLKYNNQIVCTQ